MLTRRYWPAGIPGIGPANYRGRFQKADFPARPQARRYPPCLAETRIKPGAGALGKFAAGPVPCCDGRGSRLSRGCVFDLGSARDATTRGWVIR